MQLSIGILVLVVAAGVASPISRQKRFAPWDPWTSTGAMAGGFAGGGGAFAGAGAGFMPFPFMPMTPDYVPRVPYYYPMNFPFNFNFPQPWYKGANVCVERRVVDEPDEFKELMDDPSLDPGRYEHESQSCRGSDTAYVCTGRVMTNNGSKMYVTKYQCCHGFIRPYNGQPGCVEIDLKDLAPALRAIGAIRFVELAEQLGLLEKLHDGNFTVFCPTNAALDAFVEDNEENNEVTSELEKEDVEQKTVLLKMVTSHLTPGFIRSDDVEDEDILQTNNSAARIRVNIYFTPHKLMTANCVPMMTFNNYARNGVIHVVERVLPIPSRTVADIIAGDSQFSILKKMLSKAGLVQTLRNPKGNFTVFAPTDSAFNTRFQLQEKLRNGSLCTASVMKNHILDHVICSTALPNHARSVNMIGELLTLTRDMNNKLYVDDIQVVVKDIVGTNGVVHIIDGLLMPSQAKSITEVLQEADMSEFMDLLELADMKSIFDSMENVTFFIPGNEAIRKMPSAVLENILSSSEKLQEILLYHVAKPQLMTSDTQDSQLLQTKVEDKNIRINQYSSYPYITKLMTVQCARILSPDNKLCGSTLHVIDRLLIPPKKTVMDALETMEQFSELVRLLEATGMDQRLRTETESFTVLAPMNDAFYQSPEASINQLINNRLKAIDFLKMHILSETLCCEQVKHSYSSGRQQTRSIDGSLLRIQRSQEGFVRIGQARIIDCDIMAGNGVIHMLDSVVFPDRSNMNGGLYLDNVFSLF